MAGLLLPFSHSENSPCSQYQQRPHAITEQTTTPVADLVAADLGADLDDLAHELMADHVPGAHEGDVAAELVQVGPTDRAEVDLEDRVLVVEQLRVGVGALGLC